MRKIKDKDVEDQIVSFCDNFKAKMLHKFYAGRAEHDDDLATLPIEKEIEQEIIDIVIYSLIAKLQRGLK
jgi:hypothetical protein